MNQFGVTDNKILSNMFRWVSKINYVSNSWLFIDSILFKKLILIIN